MAIFASTTLGSSDPSKAMNIKALEARAQALAAAQAKQEAPTSMPSPWQGAGYLANTLADTVATKRADQQAMEQKAQLAALMGGVGPEGPNPQQLAGITARDTDLGKMYAQQAFQSRQGAEQIQAQKEAAAQAVKDREAAAVAQEQRVQGRPQTDVGKLKADLDAGRMTQEEHDAAVRKLTAGSPADQAAMGTAREENISLQALKSQMDEADQLLKGDKVYSGSGAGWRTDYGQALDKFHLGGVTGTSPEQNAASQRVKVILNAQAVQTLKAMKGSASNTDRDFAIATVNDPTAPIENKRKAMALLQAHIASSLQSSEQTLKGMGTAPVKVETGAGGASAAPTADPMEGRTISNDKGEKMIRRNGKWEPM